MSKALHRRLSLHQLCAMEIEAETLIDVAADAGFDHVCLFTQCPKGMGLNVPLVTQDRQSSVRTRLDDRGISVLNIEVFILDEQTSVAAYRPAIELGAALGAKSATVIVTDTDRNRAVDNFAALCAIAADYGITPGLEWMAFSPVTTLQQAVDIVTAAGQPNGRLTVDLLHLIRNGDTIEALAALPAELIGYVQLCDGPAIAPPDAWHEAVCDRGILGQGDFPVTSFLAAVPPALPVAIEVPLDRLRNSGVDCRQRAALLAQAARKLTAALSA